MSSPSLALEVGSNGEKFWISRDVRLNPLSRFVAVPALVARSICWGVEALDLGAVVPIWNRPYCGTQTSEWWKMRISRWLHVVALYFVSYEIYFITFVLGLSSIQSCEQGFVRKITWWECSENKTSLLFEHLPSSYRMIREWRYSSEYIPSNEFMARKTFAENPTGTDFEPEDLVEFSKWREACIHQKEDWDWR